MAVALRGELLDILFSELLLENAALSLYSSLSAFDEDCEVVDDYFGHEFKFLMVSSGGGEVVA